MIVGMILIFIFMFGIVLVVVGSVFIFDILWLMGMLENVIDVSV